MTLVGTEWTEKAGNSPGWSVAARVLTAASLALLLGGQKQLGSVAALYAVAVEGGSRLKKPAEEKKEESKAEGWGARRTQDDKPYRWGGVTQDGKPGGRGGATTSVQDGKAASRVIGTEDGGSALGELGTQARTVTPGLRTLRTCSGRHGEQLPIPPSRATAGRGRAASGYPSTEGQPEPRVGYSQQRRGEGSIEARGRAASMRSEPDDQEISSGPTASSFPDLDMSPFLDEPRGEDGWDFRFWDRRYLIRKHGKGRKMLFYPLHQSTPCRGESLSEDRVTVCGYSDGATRIREDSWQDHPPWKSTAEWKGYTTFKRKVCLEMVGPEEEYEVVR